MKKIIYMTSIVFLAAAILAPECRSQAWTNLGSGLSNSGQALAFDRSGNLYVGGEFTNAGGLAVNRIAKWDGSTWTNLPGERAGGNIYELAFDSSGNLYAAGGNTIEKWNGSTWTNISAGMDYFVYALACDNSGNLYAGGSFSTVGGVAASCIAKWNGTTWSSLGGGMDYYVEALVCDSAGNLYAGGEFTNAGGVAASCIAKWDGTTWSNLGSGIHGGTGDSVKALAMDRAGNLYAGGMFSTAGDVDAFAVAKWNGTSWINLGGGMNYEVNALACDGSSTLYAGGEFNTAGGGAAARIAKWNGTAWSSLGSGLNNSPVAVACDSASNMYCAGYFSAAGGLAANYIAKWIEPQRTIGPLIKANGQVGSVTINSSDTLSLTVQLDPGEEYAGIEVDWWVAALAGTSWYYLNSSLAWIPEDNLLNWRPVSQGAMGNVPATEVLNIRGLASGSYTFWFALEYPMDGILKVDGPILFNTVNVTVR